MNEQRKRFVPQPGLDRAAKEAAAAGHRFVFCNLGHMKEDMDAWDSWCKENLFLDHKNKLLVLRFYGDYAIDLRRARTHQQILDWVHHLLGKRIFHEHEDGCEVIARIAKILCGQAGLSIYKPGRVRKTKPTSLSTEPAA